MVKKKKFGDNVAKAVTGTINTALGIKNPQEPKQAQPPVQQQPQQEEVKVETGVKTETNAASQNRADEIVRQREKLASRLGISSKQAGEMVANSPEQAQRQAQAQQEQAIAQNTSLAQNVGQTTQQDNIQPQALDFNQAIKAGLATAAPSAIGGAVVGSAAGGIGAIPTAAIGAVGGFIAGIRSNLKSQAAGDIRASTISIREGEQNIRALITDTNQNPQNAAENLALMNYQLSRIEQEHSKLKLATQRDLNKFLGEDGTPELERYELFYSTGGTRDYLVAQMQNALLNPNPSKNLVSLSDIETE